LPFDCHHTGDGRLGVRRSPRESRENAAVGSLAGELRLELTADWKKVGEGSLAGELRLEWMVDWKKVGVGSLARELRLEFMVENPRLAGGFDTERIAFGVPKRVRCFESIDREVET
jgi:hypothetical protein